MSTPTQSMPSLFISHGSPMVSVELDAYTDALAAFGGRVKPRAIVVVSAHWEAGPPLRVTTSEQPKTIHDFGGFPDELYALRYPVPGHPTLAGQVIDRLKGAGFEAVADPVRGLDHGAWVPLRHAFPAASIPTIQLSLGRRRSEEELLRMGRALAPLRKEGVLLVGSGGVVHNLRVVNFGDKYAPVDPWADAFDRWIAERVKTVDAAAVAGWRTNAPNAQLSVPTSEHFDPLLVTMGSALAGDAAQDVFVGFHHANLSMRTFALGA